MASLANPLAWLAACVVLPMGLVACGGSDSVAPNAATSVTAVIDAAGGTVTGPDGLQVIIPAGALKQATTIGIARTSVGAPDALDAYPVSGFVYELTPHDLPFNVPVTVRAPVGIAPDMQVFMASPGQPWIATSATVTNGMAEWQRSSFSWMYAGACLRPTSMVGDPYWCASGVSVAHLSAVPVEAMTQTELPRDPANGAFGAYRVDQNADLQLSQFVRVPGNCSNVTVRFLRRRWADPLYWWHPGVVAQTQVLPTQYPVISVAGAGYITGTATVTVPFTYADGGHNQFVMAASYDCPGIIRSPNGNGGFNYSWDTVHLRHTDMWGDTIMVEGNVPTTTVLYAVGGTVSGLTGTGLILQNNGVDNKSVTADGTFNFATAIASGAAYAVTVQTQPTGQICTVTNGSGTASANVTNVAVTCVAAPVNSIIPRFAYVSNVNDNSVSIFAVDATTGLLSDHGYVATGTNPQSVTVDPSGKFAYVANHDSNDVSAYTINASTGALTSVGSAAPAGTNPYSVTVDPTGKFAYVANFGSDNVSVYSINATTGALTGTGTVVSGAQPISVTVHPTGKFAYVAANGGVLRAYTINATTGALTMVSDVAPAPGFSLRSVTVDPSGKFAYAPVAYSGVMVYNINPATGSLTADPGNPVTAGNFPISIAVAPTGRFAYVVNYDSGTVSSFAINAMTGALSLAGTVTAGTQPSFISIEPSGKFAFVTNQGSSTVSGYRIDATTGILTALPTVTSRSGPSSVVTTGAIQ